MERKELILVGGGGHCKSVIEVAESAGYSILGILDMPEEVGKTVLDYKVVGTDDDIPQFVGKAEFVITVGFIKNPAIRIRIFDKIKSAGGRLATIIASTARVSKYAEVGEGTVVMHQA
ncbi:MAG: acetyltransferase, partial [Paludibacteraceae bacterium]|nr:acetyltransferase [Paludibacteraceae bacterium]